MQIGRYLIISMNFVLLCISHIIYRSQNKTHIIIIYLLTNDLNISIHYFNVIRLSTEISYCFVFHIYSSLHL